MQNANIFSFPCGSMCQTNWTHVNYIERLEELQALKSQIISF